jgi:signal transduction histidine kinase
MLGVLRSTAAEEDDLSPQPQWRDLPELVERVRQAGLPVELEVSGGQDVPAAVGLSAYRIVQEALTNVLKHAGPVPTAVRLERDGHAVRLDVTNALSVPAQRSPDGRGLLGMQERVALHGGLVECGPEDGRWAVHAVLPLTT